MTAHRRLLAGLLLCAVAPALWLYCRHVGPLPGERRASSWVLEHRVISPGYSGTLQFFASLAVWPVGIATIAIAAWILARHGSWAAATLLVLAAVAVLLNEAFAHLVGQTILRRELSGPAVGTGFPSGHVTYAVSVFGALALIGRREGHPELAAVCLLLVVGMCLARLLDTSHVVSDVIAAVCLGGGWLLVCDAALDLRRTAATSRQSA